MKTVCLVLLSLAMFSVRPCSAQGIKTVVACRAYREAWLTSADDDVRRLSVRELVQRANQMMMCAKEIDSQPFTAQMTKDDSIKVGVELLGYPLLASVYMQEFQMLKAKGHGTAQCQHPKCDNPPKFFTNWKTDGEGGMAIHPAELCKQHAEEFIEGTALQLPRCPE